MKKGWTWKDKAADAVPIHPVVGDAPEPQAPEPATRASHRPSDSALPLTQSLSACRGPHYRPATLRLRARPPRPRPLVLQQQEKEGGVTRP